MSDRSLPRCWFIRAIRLAAVATAFASAPVAVAAQWTVGVYLGSTPSIVVAPGRTFTVPVIIDMSSAHLIQFNGFTTDVLWNPAVLTLQSIAKSAGSALNITSSTTTNAATGVANFRSFSFSAPLKQPTTAAIVDLSFTASMTAGGTRVMLSPRAVDGIGNNTFDLVPWLRLRMLDVCVAATGKWGDVTNDGVVDVVDAQQLARYAVGLSVLDSAAVSALGDVSADGVVNIVDAQQVARFSVALPSAPRTNTDLWVPPIPTSISVTPSVLTAVVETSIQQFIATPMVNGVDVSGCAGLTWETSDSTVAIVNASGLVTGVAAGTATITARSVVNPLVTGTAQVAVPAPASVQLAVSHAGRPARYYVVNATGGGIPVRQSYVFDLGSMNDSTLTLPLPSPGDYTLRVAAFELGSGAPSGFYFLFLAGNQLSVTIPAVGGVQTRSTILTPPVYTVAPVPTSALAGTLMPVSWTLTDPSGLLDARGNTLYCGAIQESLSRLTTDFGGPQGVVPVCNLTFPAPGTITYAGSVPVPTGGDTLFFVMRNEQVMLYFGGDTPFYYFNPVPSRGEAPVTVSIAHIATVAVAPPSATVPVNGMLQLVATARDGSGAVRTQQPAAWTSSNPSVATVSATGRVVGLASGTAVVSAKVAGIVGTTTITVAGTIVVGSVAVSLNSSTLSGNALTTANAVVRDPGNNMVRAAVTWSASSPMIARVAADGTVQALGTGTTQITATSGGVSASAPLTVNPVAQGFNIDLRPLTSMTPGVQAAFSNAVTRWQTIIRGDIPSVTFSNFDVSACTGGPMVLNETVDDLVIYASVQPIDGVHGILGAAGPCYVRSGSELTIVGIMMFDSADMAELEANGMLQDVILHEMGHVLGFGTLWEDLGLLPNPAPSSPDPAGDPVFTGVNGQWAFRNLGTGYGGAIVPVENCCSPGTRNGHWRESVLMRELMTGFITPAGQPNPLSPLTAASLIDLGYVVDVSQSDPPPAWFLRAGVLVPGLRIPIKEGVMPRPRFVDRNGRIVPR